jgi:hypothetical protein
VRCATVIYGGRALQSYSSSSHRRRPEFGKPLKRLDSILRGNDKIPGFLQLYKHLGCKDQDDIFTLVVRTFRCADRFALILFL